MDILEIMSILPHRYPFLMVDRILEQEPMKRVKGLKNVTVNEPFFQGHFPNNPIMPGVLILETMAQIGGFAFDIRDKHAFVVGINNAKFRQQVIPGDTLIVEGTVVGIMAGVGKVAVKAYVNDKVVATAEITYSFTAA